MAKKKKGQLSSSGALQLGFDFGEDEHLYGSPADILKCEGAPVALDTETTGLEWFRDRVLGIGVWCSARGVAVYIDTLDERVLAACRENLQTIARNPQTEIRMHNMKFDMEFMGVPLWSRGYTVVDTTILAHLYDSRLRKTLDNLEQTFLGTQTKEQHLAGNRGKDILHMSRGAVAEYCVNDCRVTYELVDAIRPEVNKLGLSKLLQLQMEYVGLLQAVEQRGIALDLEFLERAEKRFFSNLVKMEEELFAKAGKVFNWRSPIQLGHALYEGMGLPRPVNPFLGADGIDHTRFATRGKYNKSSTSSFLLGEKSGHPLAFLVMDMRETDKLMDYARDWRGFADSQRVLHTSYNPTGTRTGRLSSSRPNFQNVPGLERVRYTQSVYSGGVIRENEYNLRTGFVARPGHLFVSVDFAQQEMRLFALTAKEDAMIQAIRNREDIHAMIAREVWGDDIRADPSLLPIRREWSKTISFGLLYGMTTGSLEHRLNKTREESHRIAQQYWARFPRIQPYMKEVIEQCRKQGYVRYWSSRIWREENEQDQYRAVNAIVQGGGADLLMTAALRVQKYLDSLGCGAHIVNFVHDELISEVPVDLIEEVAPKLQQIQEVEDLFQAPFLTEAKVGSNYGQLIKYAKWKEQRNGKNDTQKEQPPAA